MKDHTYKHSNHLFVIVLLSILLSGCLSIFMTQCALCGIQQTNIIFEFVDKETITGVVKAIEHTPNGYIISVTFKERSDTLDLVVSPEEATNYSVGDTVFISLDFIISK